AMGGVTCVNRRSARLAGLSHRIRCAELDVLRAARAAGVAMAVRFAINCCAGGERGAMAQIARAAGPGLFLFLTLLGRIVLALILLAWIVHLVGGGMLDLRLGHFRLDVGFT